MCAIEDLIKRFFSPEHDSIQTKNYSNNSSRKVSSVHSSEMFVFSKYIFPAETMLQHQPGTLQLPWVNLVCHQILQLVRWGLVYYLDPLFVHVHYCYCCCCFGVGRWVVVSPSSIEKKELIW